MLLHGSVLHSFSLVNRILLYGRTIRGLFMHQLKDIWVVSSLGKFGIKLLLDICIQVFV